MAARAETDALWSTPMRQTVVVLSLLAAALGLFPQAAAAKDYKSGEYNSNSTYGFGAFEARIRAAEGPGVISTFFLWKPNSEVAGQAWEEIDFEIGTAGADFQTQVMTPGKDGSNRTEHVVYHNAPNAKPWDTYYTYRIEWTPDYIAFFVNGAEIRRVTDHTEYTALFNTDGSGDVPSGERMQVRLGVWPGASNIWGWSGVFDGSSVPTAEYVDYVKVWDYTPGASNPFQTLLLEDNFDSLDYGRWNASNWTFEYSASDYVPQNLGISNGKLVASLTRAAQQGYIPPEDDSSEEPPTEEPPTEEPPAEEPPTEEPPPATASVSARLNVTTDWGSGYCADLIVSSTTAISTWSVSFSTPSAEIYTYWNFNRTGTPAAYGATPVGWNSQIPAGSSQSVGFCANRSGGSAGPTVLSAQGS